MTTHTPGPWKFRDSAGLVNTYYVEGPHRADGHYWIVAEVGGQGKDNAHNARLIAAAPDLLEACEAALDRGVGEVKAISMIKTAIAKAKGNS